MMKITLIIAFLLTTWIAMPQKSISLKDDFNNKSVLTAAGSSFQTDEMSISWTLGDTVMTLEIVDEDLVSSDTEEIDFYISTFPNPVVEKLNISHNSDENEALTVAIHDLFGRALITKQLLYKKNEINVRKLPSALYEVIIRNSKGQMVKSYKLIKH